MAGIFSNFPRDSNRSSRLLRLIRRRPPRLAEDESDLSRRIRQVTYGTWTAMKLILLIPLLVLIFLGVVILIQKIISILGPLL